ncbi:BMP family ABC transporter substrate-binding protein [Methanofollis sp. UBA420]|jgi:basic membrane protein A|uniref:BMP family ABC transporter substrate-binding protein n=1 Tax=Methanofollis sp. UBA420 TaxID=1915514 RepID=UPI00316ACA50
MKPSFPLISLTIVLALLLAAAGCTGSSSLPSVYILYGSDIGDLSYTDTAHQGLLAAHDTLSFTAREFTPRDCDTLPGLLAGTEKPGLVITVGYQYANLTRQLAQDHPDIRFLAVDQAGIGSDNVRAYEFVSYGDSYLAGVLAASATRTGRVGIILGTQSDLLDTFLRGYTDGARAVNASVVVDHAYVRQHSTDGFTDPGEAGRIAERMYGTGTDVIFTCAGYSSMGVFDAAGNATGRYIIGTDTDQSPLGPDVVLASAIKRVDRVVSTGIAEHLNGTFTGGDQVAGLEDGATGIVVNPRFAVYNETVSAWEVRAQDAEEAYLRRSVPESGFSLNQSVRPGDDTPASMTP